MADWIKLTPEHIQSEIYPWIVDRGRIVAMFRKRDNSATALILDGYRDHPIVMETPEEIMTMPGISTPPQAPPARPKAGKATANRKAPARPKTSPMKYWSRIGHGAWSEMTPQAYETAYAAAGYLRPLANAPTCFLNGNIEYRMGRTMLDGNPVEGS